RRRRSDNVWDTSNLGGRNAHDGRRDQRGFASGDITADGADRDDALPKCNSIAKAFLELVHRFALPLGKVGYLLFAEGKVLLEHGTHRASGSRNLGIRDTEGGLRPLVELGRVSPDGGVAVRLDVQQHRADAGYE